MSFLSTLRNLFRSPRKARHSSRPAARRGTLRPTLEFLETRDCPSGLDVLPFLYVANFGTGEVREYSATGADLGVLASGLSGPADQLAFDSSGNLYVPENFGNTIRRYSPAGVDLGVFASTGLNGPEGLAFDQAGNVYVGNNFGGTIRKFSPTGVDLGDFVTGIPDIIRDLAFDSAGNLYVAERGNGLIRRFSPTGEDLGNFASGLRGPLGLAFDNAGNLYISEEGGNDIRRFSPTGVDLGVFGTGLFTPDQIVFDPSSGDLCVADATTGHILRYSPAGGAPQVFAINSAAAAGIAIRPTIGVSIDIKPGSTTDPINLANHGVIPVAIFGSATFNVSQVDVSSVIFAGAHAAQYSAQDVNGDGLLDLVLQFRTQDTQLRSIYEQLLADDINGDGVLDSNHQAATVTLTGETVDHAFIEGADELDLFLSGKPLRSLLDALAASGAM